MPALIKRELQQAITEELASDKIILVTGPRQSGKTTLLTQIASELKRQGEQVYFYNFDRTADLDFFSNQQKVEAFLRIRSIKSILYIFIDEVQRKKDAGNFFKYFYDAGLKVKFIFSGSSSVELTDAFGDALTGRKRIFTLLPLSIKEIFQGQYPDEWAYAALGEPLANEHINEIVSQSLIWGNYPEVTHKKTPETRIKTLGELYESYVQKDVKDLLRVKNVSGFNLLVKVLAHNVGNAIVVEDLVRQTGLHTATVNSYLNILEGTMILARTDNYNPDFSDKLPKSQRYYFLDNGMRNYALGQLNDDFRADYKQLAANLLYAELLKRSYAGTLNAVNQDLPEGTAQELKASTINIQEANIFHYQTYSDNHVDFIIVPKLLNQPIAVVVRYPEQGEKLGKKIHEYLNTQKPKQLYVITKAYSQTGIVKDCEVIHLTLAEFIAKLS